jgi:hypothetical protein
MTESPTAVTLPATNPGPGGCVVDVVVVGITVVVVAALAVWWVAPP